jgi:peptidylprolyl isomerase
VGQQLQMTRPNGVVVTVVVTAVSISQVTLDANHPLAGKDLIFDITLVDIGQEHEQ